MKTKKMILTSQNLSSVDRSRSLLHRALVGLVFSSVNVLAVSSALGEQAPRPAAFTLKITTHGEGANRSDNMSEPARQDNRRTDVKIKTTVQNGTRTVVDRVGTAGRTVYLNDGGTIWVTKDPASLTPTLNVTTGQSVAINSGKFVSPISFDIRTNYGHFIDGWKLSVYKESDEDHRNPVVTFMGRELANSRTVKWNGISSDGKRLHSGEQLFYVLTVKDKAGHHDETKPRRLSLLGSERNIKKLDNANPSNREANNLARQTIPLHGSRVRISGNDIVEGHKVTIDQEIISVVDQKFVVEKLLPDGKHSFDVRITDNNNNVYKKPLSVELDSKYMFMVGIADITVGESKITGNLKSLSNGDKRLDGDIFVDGRLAFYLKGKIKGKYLVTAQMDTGTAPVEDLFDDIHKKDPRSIFRRLDPDKYYSVYGDDSTLIDDTDSQGKMYVRVDWDKSRALWGNYNTDMTGTELSSFNRSLYGAKLNHKSTQITKDGDHKSDITLFASEVQSAFRHNQFLGTGGSLYYLKDTDIVDGSEKVWIEIRQENSDRSVKKIVLEEGRDYEIDDFQGRIILHRALLQIAEQSNPSLIKNNPLDGDQVYLMVDYEYVPDSGFTSDRASYGARGKFWVADQVALGATYAHESRDSDDYDLKGVDITLKKSKGTYIKGEYSETKSSQTQGSFLSNDGGLNFDPFINNALVSNISGNAYSVEARANLQDFGNKEGYVGAWYKHREAGFSISNVDNGEEKIDAGVEALVKATESLRLSMRAILSDRKATKKTTTGSIQADYKKNDKLTLSGEVRNVKEVDRVDNTKDGEGILGAFKVGYDLNKDVNLYAIAQATIDKKGAYDDNDLFTVGTKAKINNKLDLNIEVSTGDRGNAATVAANYRVNDGYSLYTSYTLSTDRTDKDGSTFTVGQRKTLTNQLKVYTEHQFTHEDKQSGVGHTFGLDYQLSKEINIDTSLQTARLNKTVGGLTDRDAFSVGLSYKKNKTNASTRLEYRRDKGAIENTEQWVSTNRVNYRVSPSLRLQGKFNYSNTRDKIGNSNNAKFVETGLGFALRPVSNDRLNVLGRLTYVYDLQPLSRSTRPDEESLIASIESNYQINQRWEVGGKIAHKQGEIRANRNAGAWEKNDATLVATRVRYHLTHNWDAMGEYHWMNSDESQDSRHGAMVSVDRHIGKNMKIGIGYNFTNFDDDLSDTTGATKGWFINLVGKY